jgi:hypothetical protein
MSTVSAEANGVVVASPTFPEFSWGAVIAGAVVAASVFLFLLALGFGVGLSLFTVPQTVPGGHPSAVTGGAIYFFAAQAFALATGGYLAGRLMGPVLESEDEEIFHASAHGIVTWALSVATAVSVIALAGFLLTSVGVTAAAAMASSGGAAMRATAQPTDYWVDALFRPAAAATPGADATIAATDDSGARAEAGRILMRGLPSGEHLATPDRERLIALVSSRAGIDATTAGSQVDDVLRQMRQEATDAAEAARRATRTVMLWLAASLVFGALVAAAAAVTGRRADDEARAAP